MCISSRLENGVIWPYFVGNKTVTQAPNVTVLIHSCVCYCSWKTKYRL